MLDSTVVTPGTHCYLKDVVTGKGCIERIDEQRRSIRVFKKLPPIPTSLLLGLPYGATLELRGGEWIRVPRMRAEEFVQAVKKAAGYRDDDDEEEIYCNENENPQPSRKRQRLEACGGNSVMVDDNSAQSLKPKEVIAMKESGVDGVKLISTLVSNSSTFGIRSDFSQEKYILRKMKTHLVQIAILKCDAVNVANAYHDATKLGGLRPNDVYMMMNEANVTAGNSVIVFDHAVGYLTMNVLNRLGGHGTCLFLSDKKGVSHHIVDQCNLKEEFRQSFVMLPMNLLAKAVSTKFADESLLHHEWFQDCDILEAVIKDESKPDVDREKARLVMEKRKARRQERFAVWTELQKASFDSFLAVIDPSRVEANSPRLLAELLSDIYRLVLRTVRPGGRFVCYCAQMNPLVDLASHMKSRRHTWNNIRLEETFVRKICVLPGRSHPQMEGNLRLFEGYLLTASRMTETEQFPTALDGSMVV
eukprot:Gregarina_sp_Poly_1__97@NODE_1020_length_5329_cov_521_329913_g711_i0_p2_GENE_NODE_1020_length_5329_cov_521_329913_g711_i0NODE_1020_length_5329_cov_521_329913_g711_i0_p2_ORF_typecomplete_len475_score58_35Gcd10p/PF04189_13/1_6e49GCD14/PF08704_10/2e02GCD14/PF08704_10/0_25CCDC23/PF15674_5/4_9CCDC23/PF15674_5/55_NODE_1020_length_5329_cov_521_329913_g711_i022673691